MSGTDEAQVIAAAHTAAEDAGEALYRDPFSGLYVFTATALRERGYCCEQGCRHCPYGHAQSSTSESGR